MNRRWAKALFSTMNVLNLAIYDVAKVLVKKASQALVDFTKKTINSSLQFETAFVGVKKVVNGPDKDFAKLQAEIKKQQLRSL